MENNSSTDRERIANRLKEARTLAGLSQEQAALKLGVKRPAISEIEAGKRKVSAEEIIQFAELYKVDTNWLLLQEGSEDLSRKVAARGLDKMSDDQVKKLLDILKVLPK